nr:ribonuclease R [uncultured Desulfobulbus sp.]
MARKFPRRKKTAAASRKKRTSHETPGRQRGSLQASVLGLLNEIQEPLGIRDIAQALYLGRSQLTALHKALDSLLEDRKIEKQGRQFVSLSRPDPLRATLEVTAKGFGFAVLEGEQAEKGKDIFIAPHNLADASHGDTVLLALIKTNRNRREGRVLEVLERAVTTFCGIFNAGYGGGGFVAPDDDRLPYTVTIRPSESKGAQDGSAVLAEITDYGSERQGPSGRIVDILGDAKDASVQIRMAISQFSLRDHFPAEVENEAALLSAVNECEPGRRDLRHLPHVTIDGETARDFDDAICVEHGDEGYTLYVSIADVSHYVRTNSAIDREAYLRGTSVYLPDRVLPMLPERLSNDLCSLVPDQDRAAFTAILRFDHQGKRIGERYCKSLIKSQQRFTYTTVNRILSLKEAAARREFAALLPMLEQADQLTKLLKKRRIARGSLEFNLPEPEVRLEGDRVSAIHLAERNQAHQLIEDCMLAANEAVAETLAKAERPVLYRIHERPDPIKLETFTDAAKALGLTLPRSEVSPAWFAEVIRQAANSSSEYIVNNLLLRTMQQARYAPENVGHFGLAAPFYLHFTSPIRRYPDLVAHRVLQAFLEKSTMNAPSPGKETNLTEAGLHLSQCERKAIDVERNVHARCSALFLLDRVGDVFSAIISGVTAFGLYLTLDETYISGMIPIATMTDDYYLHDSRRYRLIAQGSNRMYQLGDRVSARLDHVDLATKRISFSLAAATPENEPKNSDTPAF